MVSVLFNKKKYRKETSLSETLSHRGQLCCQKNEGRVIHGKSMTRIFKRSFLTFQAFCFYLAFEIRIRPENSRGHTENKSDESTMRHAIEV